MEDWAEILRSSSSNRPMLCVSARRLIHPVAGANATRVPGLGGDRQRCRQVRFPVARWAEQDDVAGSVGDELVDLTWNRGAFGGGHQATCLDLEHAVVGAQVSDLNIVREVTFRRCSKVQILLP